MNVWRAILWKDLRSEWRSRDRVVAMLLFSLLVVVVFNFALPDATRRDIATHAPGLLWVAFIFASLLGLGRTFAAELENDAMGALALAPVERGWIFLGKASASFAIVAVVQIVTTLAFAVAFGIDLWQVAGPLALVAGLGTAGICLMGTLLSALTARTRLRELLLPLLLLPALFPLLAGAVRATTAAMAGKDLPFDAVQLLIVVDSIYAIVGFLTFDYVLED